MLDLLPTCNKQSHVTNEKLLLHSAKHRNAEKWKWYIHWHFRLKVFRTKTFNTENISGLTRKGESRWEFYINVFTDYSDDSRKWSLQNSFSRQTETTLQIQSNASYVQQWIMHSFKRQNYVGGARLTQWPQSITQTKKKKILYLWGKKKTSRASTHTLRDIHKWWGLFPCVWEIWETVRPFTLPACAFFFFTWRLACTH